MQYDCVLWDWNGTIVDDARIGFEAFCQILRRRGLAETSFDFYREHITTPISDFYSLFFDLTVIPFSELDDEFNRNYAALSDRLCVTPGIRTVLEDFKTAGTRQAILTSSWAHVVERNASLLGVRDLFDEVLGGHSITDGSKIGRAKTYLQKHGIPANRTLVIGDTLHDAEVATEIGAHCVLVSFGHQSRHILAQAALPVADSVQELMEMAGLRKALI